MRDAELLENLSVFGRSKIPYNHENKLKRSIDFARRWQGIPMKSLGMISTGRERSLRGVRASLPSSSSSVLIRLSITIVPYHARSSQRVLARWRSSAGRVIFVIVAEADLDDKNRATQIEAKSRGIRKNQAILIRNNICIVNARIAGALRRRTGSKQRCDEEANDRGIEARGLRARLRLRAPERNRYVVQGH